MEHGPRVADADNVPDARLDPLPREGHGQIRPPDDSPRTLGDPATLLVESELKPWTRVARVGTVEADLDILEGGIAGLDVERRDTPPETPRVALTLSLLVPDEEHDGVQVVTVVAHDQSLCRRISRALGVSSAAVRHGEPPLSTAPICCRITLGRAHDARHRVGSRAAGLQPAPRLPRSRCASRRCYR